MSKENKTWTDVGILILLLPWLFILKGVCVSYFWNWFVAEPFKIFEIGIFHAIGLSMLYSTLNFKNSKDDEVDEPIEKMLMGIILYLAFLLIGWVVHLFM